jgi:hypothetical protein
VKACAAGAAGADPIERKDKPFDDKALGTALERLTRAPAASP